MPIIKERSNAAATADRTSESNLFAENRMKPRKVFAPSMDQQRHHTTIGYLLGWEYGRKWLEERNRFVRENPGKPKRRYIHPDFQWWISKRTTILDRRRLFTMRQKQPQLSIKKTPISAFNMSREKRLNQRKLAEMRSTHSSDPESSSLMDGHYESDYTTDYRTLADPQVNSWSRSSRGC